MNDTAVTVTDLLCHTVREFYFKRLMLHFETFCKRNKMHDTGFDYLWSISSNNNSLFWVTPSMFCLPAVTKCRFRNMVTVQPVYAQVKCGKWGKNEEHLRCIKFATGWTVTLPYWAAVKQGLTTSTPPLASSQPPPPEKKKKHLHPLPKKDCRGGKELTWGEERGTKVGGKDQGRSPVKSKQ